MGEYRHTTGEKPPATGQERRQTRVRVVLVLVILALALVVGGRLIKMVQYVPASGYATTAVYAEVRSPVVGQIIAIEKRSGDTVEAGDVLIRLNDLVERALLEEAKSELRRSDAELVFKEAELNEQRRERTNLIGMAKMSLEHAHKRLEISVQLSERGLASARDVMEDTFKVKMAEAEYNRLSETDFELAERQLSVLKQIKQSHQEAVSRARANLDARTIHAPIAGRLFRHTFFEGEVVRPDIVLYEVFGGDEHVLRLRVPERYATDIQVGQKVRAQLRTARRILTRLWMYGEVVEVRDTIQSEGNRTYRVIYCTFDPRSFSVPPGTTADAQIAVARKPLWRIIFGL
jgi:multidrug resistance efflux pump